jgi:hypothetical protein
MAPPPERTPGLEQPARVATRFPRLVGTRDACPPKPSTAGRLFHHFFPAGLVTGAKLHNLCQRTFSGIVEKVFNRQCRLQLLFLIRIAFCRKKFRHERGGEKLFTVFLK